MLSPTLAATLQAQRGCTKKAYAAERHEQVEPKGGGEGRGTDMPTAEGAPCASVFIQACTLNQTGANHLVSVPSSISHVRKMTNSWLPGRSKNAKMTTYICASV